MLTSSSAICVLRVAVLLCFFFRSLSSLPPSLFLSFPVCSPLFSSLCLLLLLPFYFLMLFLPLFLSSLRSPLPLFFFSFLCRSFFFFCAVHPLAFIARGCKCFPLQGRSNGRRDISRGHGPLITAFAAATVSPPATM